MSRIEPTHSTPPVIAQRELFIANHDLNLPKKYPSNFVKTSKYNAINFFPVTLFLQFKRYANIYFLIIAILQSISVISPLNPVTAIIPFVFVLSLSILREGLEDLTRHRSDREANASLCRVYQQGKFVDTQWKNVRVGDILLVKDQEFLPCDLVAISSSNEEESALLRLLAWMVRKISSQKEPLRKLCIYTTPSLELSELKEKLPACSPMPFYTLLMVPYQSVKTELY
jgi:hypothetical protein